MHHLDDAGLELAACGHDDLRPRLLALGFNATQIAQVTQGRNGAYVVANGHILTRHGNTLRYGLLPQSVPSTPIVLGENSVRGEVFMLRRCPWPIPGFELRQTRCAVIDVRAVCGGLSLRSIATADRFTPFGMRGTRLVSDYLTDRHRSRMEKFAALVLTDSEGILWLVDETVDARAAVTPETAEVYLISRCP